MSTTQQSTVEQTTEAVEFHDVPLASLEPQDAAAQIVRQAAAMHARSGRRADHELGGPIDSAMEGADAEDLRAVCPGNYVIAVGHRTQGVALPQPDCREPASRVRLHFGLDLRRTGAGYPGLRPRLQAAVAATF